MKRNGKRGSEFRLGGRGHHMQGGVLGFPTQSNDELEEKGDRATRHLASMHGLVSCKRLLECL